MLVAMLPFTGRIADKLPDHIPVMAGLAFFALGMALMTMSDVNTPFWTFATFAIVGRIGLAFILPSLNAAALRALPPSQLNKGSGALNFVRQPGRSEEHTSELQSLMRISYAVFCLQQKNKHDKQKDT